MFRLPFSRWVMLFAASGFAMLLLDAAHAHHYTLSTHPWAWTPLIFAPVGALVFAAAGLIWRTWLLRVSQAVAVVAVVVGLLGTYFHNQQRFERDSGQSHAGLLERLGVSASAWAHGEEGRAARGKDRRPAASAPEANEAERAAPDRGEQEPMPPTSEEVGETRVERRRPAAAGPEPTWLERYYADRHPPLAPLSFAGMGFIGFLAAGFGVRSIAGSLAAARPDERGEE